MEFAEAALLGRTVGYGVESPDGTLGERSPVADRDGGFEGAEQLDVRLLTGRLSISLVLDRARCFNRLLHVARRE
jgi:hypothetical protein